MIRRSLIALALSVSLPASAALFDRGNGLIYDDVLNITWLQDANYAVTSGYVAANLQNNGQWKNGQPVRDNILADGAMGWDAAMTWVDQLEYQGFTNWRLPKALPMSFCTGGTAECDARTSDNIYSELAHLYYETLGNDRSSAPNFSPFTNVQVDDNLGLDPDQGGNGWYWTETESGTKNGLVQVHKFGQDTAIQKDDFKRDEYYAWAVADGDVAPIPVPAALVLFASGLGLFGAMRRAQSKAA